MVNRSCRWFWPRRSMLNRRKQFFTVFPAFWFVDCISGNCLKGQLRNRPWRSFLQTMEGKDTYLSVSAIGFADTKRDDDGRKFTLMTFSHKHSVYNFRLLKMSIGRPCFIKLIRPEYSRKTELFALSISSPLTLFTPRSSRSFVIGYSSLKRCCVPFGARCVRK